jgi:hypothetical protein
MLPHILKSQCPRIFIIQVTVQRTFEKLLPVQAIQGIVLYPPDRGQPLQHDVANVPDIAQLDRHGRLLRRGDASVALFCVLVAQVREVLEL